MNNKNRMATMATNKNCSIFDITGIESSDEADLKRAFDFEKSTTVNDKYKKPQNLKFKNDCLKVSGDGIFYTVQGEGPTMGMPCCFLRLHICNLKCVWCDAWYTWNSKTKEFWTESQDWTIQETKERLKKCWGCKNPKMKKRVVITGGEPLLQKARIEQLAKIMPDWSFEIETNCTIMPTEYMLKKFQFNCSPKLSNSKNIKQTRIKEPVLIALNHSNAVFKFVVMTNEDLDEIESDFVNPFNLDLSKIIVMPQGVTADEVRHNAQRVVEYAKEKGYRIMGRLQNEIWGAKRKV